MSCRSTAVRAVLSALLLIWSGRGVAAQASDAESETNGAADAQATFPEGVDAIDRIVAIVGDTAVLESELRVTMFQLEARGARIPPEGSPEWNRFARQVLVAEIDRLIMLQQAKRAGLTPDPNAADRGVETEFQRARAQFATEDEMVRAVETAGMNMLQYRQLLRRNVEADLLFEEYRFTLQSRTDLPSVLITESEVEEFFQENGGGEQQRPALVSFNQLVITPAPSGAARDSALARVVRARTEIEEGEEFEIVARRYSQDDANRESGGELGWNTRDIFVKGFGDAAWGARPGSTIGPVRTRFGLHLIKIERQRGPERFLRHILIRPEISDDDLALARELAAEVADSLRAGVPPERLMRTYAGQIANEDVRFDEIPVDQLTGRFQGEAAAALEVPTAGQIYGPLEIRQGGPLEYALIHVLTYRPAGPLELDDVRDQIRSNIRISKQLDILLGEIRDNTFIDVKLESEAVDGNE
ncbi:MAG: peptidylprolyl isomerase [Gemmatimonadetes bacterium]|nr:peptidylprolyl isomerase [Gemmatimonadota bacterium]